MSLLPKYTNRLSIKLRKRIQIELLSFRNTFHFQKEVGMITIKDISERCGYSPATVSKALNGYGDINKVTAENIRKIAAEMHYLPNAAARQLKTNISHNIGVLFIDETHRGLTHEYFSSILNSAKEELEKAGYDITFISRTMTGTQGSYLRHARYRKCDGILIASVDFTDPQVRELVFSDIPTVTIDYTFDSHSSVLSDNIDGGYALTKYLLDKGHRRIGLIHGEDTLVTKKRLNGFYRALKQYGVNLPPEYVTEGAYHKPSDSAAATARLMNLPEPPTVIMYPDDFSYLGGIAQLERMGLSIPNDVSVTGYDGILLSQSLRPKLTTYYQDADRIGRVSAGKLIEEIEEKATCVPEQINVSGHLIEGQTVRNL